MNNKTFKRVVALIASAVMLCSCAFAATIGEVSYKDGKLTVPYTAEGASKAAIMVTKADGTIVAVNQHDGVKTSFAETLDTTKVAIGDVLTIKVGDNAAGSTEAASTTFTIAAETFTVTFMNGEVAYATVPDVVAGRAVAEILPETAPTKEATAEKVYTFAGWYTDAELTTALAEDATVAADLTLYAKFEEAARTYTITYVVDGEETTETLAYGATPAPADPVKEGFTFTGWTPEIVAVAGDATYTATFEPIIPDAPTYEYATALENVTYNNIEATIVRITGLDASVVVTVDGVTAKYYNKTDGTLVHVACVPRTAEPVISVAAGTPEIFVFGDADDNGKFTSNDASTIARRDVNATFRGNVQYYPTDLMKLLAHDVDGNGKITSNDASTIARADVKATFRGSVVTEETMPCYSK